MSGAELGGGAPEAAGTGPEAALATVTGRIPPRSLAGWLAAVGVGAVGFAVGLAQAPERAWAAAWANFLFWTALAQAGVMFGAVLQAAKGHWGKDFRRLAEGAAAFLPLAFVIFWLLWPGARHVFPWVGEVEGHVNREWLTVGGAFLRNGAGLLLLFGLSLLYLRLALRPEAPLVAERLEGWRRSLVEWIGRKWRGDREELERSRRLTGRMAPALVLVWVGVFTLLSIDFAMSLVPGFLSVVWGAIYFVGGWLCLLALVALVANHYQKRDDTGLAWGRWQYHDLGKLLFAFVIFWTYLWWSQYLVIWYGNLGRETIFFEQRIAGGFGPLYTAQMVLIFALPFLALLGRKPKMRPGWLAAVSLLILAGFWLERHLLVLPSVGAGASSPIGWIEASVSVGFLGLFGLCYLLFTTTFPKVPVREIVVGEASRGP